MFKLFFRRYTGPWISTLFIAVFILVIKSLGLWLEDLAGSGNATIILAVAGWASLMLLPGALAIASMAASIMTVGSLKENREIYALHAAGISPIQIAKPAFVVAVLLFVLSIFATQYIAPKAYFKLTESVWNAKTAQGDIQIKSGRFLQSLEGVTLYAANERPESSDLEELLIYDRNSSKYSFPVVIVAGKGRFSLLANGIQLRLYDGSRHVPDSAGSYSRTYFDSLLVSFALPKERIAPAVPSGHRYFVPNRVLLRQIDSIAALTDSLAAKPEGAEFLYERASNDLVKVQYEWQRRWSMPANVLLFMLLGWFVGYRVGKGGLAVAGLIALGFTIVSALLLEQGKRLAYDLVVSPWLGAWLPVVGVGGLYVLFTLGMALWTFDFRNPK
ncbi:MAG: LptF/LptG family permease, partial [Bacteroidia bacterium]